MIKIKSTKYNLTPSGICGQIHRSPLALIQMVQLLVVIDFKTTDHVYLILEILRLVRCQ